VTERIGNVLSAFRVLRLFQLARAVRLLSSFKLLWTMVRGLAAAMRALIWTFFLMIVLFYLFAIIGAELIGKNEYLKNHPDAVIANIVHVQFNGVGAAMLTALQIATLDGWNSGLASPLTNAAVEDPNGKWLAAGLSVYFLSLVTMGALVLMNLVTAVIVEQSIEGAKEDSEALAAWERVEMKRLTDALERAFWSADTDNNGQLSWDELEAAYHDTTCVMHPFVSKLGDLADIKEMFTIMDCDGSGYLELKEFTEGVLRCKENFNKFMLLQLWRKENSILQRLDEILPPKTPAMKINPAFPDTDTTQECEKSTVGNISHFESNRM